MPFPAPTVCDASAAAHGRQVVRAEDPWWAVEWEGSGRLAALFRIAEEAMRTPNLVIIVLVLGSVANRLAHDAPCPVLLVP